MRRLSVIGLVALIGLFGCKDVRVASGVDDKFIHLPEEIDATPPPLEKPLFPSTVGSRWVYRLADGDTGKEEVTVTGKRVADGVTAVVFASKRLGQADREELYQITEEEINQISAGTLDKVILKPPMPLIHAPLSFTEGSSWQGGVLMRGSLLPSQAKSRLRAFEQVTVPAGTFFAYRVETDLEAQLQGGAAHFATTRWFAPGIGPVKLRYFVQAPGQANQAFVKELVSFDIKPTPIIPARGLYERR